MANPTMYLFINKGLQMSIGKAMAQSAHAAVEAFQQSSIGMLEEWYKGKHYKKIVLQARDQDHLRTIALYLRERGFKTVFIIDEGMNEVAPHSITALGVEIVDQEDPNVKATFSSFKLYKDTARVIIEIDK